MTCVDAVAQRRVDPRKQRTMDALLAAAQLMFAERPVEDVTVEEIGQHAGVAVGSIYNNFGSKEGLYAAVVARSYSDISKREQVRVDGWTYSPEYLRSGDKVLLVDDIYDSGRTVNHLTEIILEKGLPRRDVKVAVHDYKVCEYRDEKLPIVPDYWCRKHVIRNKEDEIWIHYMSHELVGLTEEELRTRYYPEDPELQEILRDLKK